jgi:hypothetical protein
MYKVIFLFIFAFLINHLDSNSQCLRGDCEDGSGLYKYKEGDQYDGEFKKGKRHGQGKYIFLDGSYQEGEWENNKLEGDAIYYNAENKTLIEGKFKNNTLSDGNVKIKYEDGTYYEGRFENYLPSGKGTMYYDSGDKYEGEWLNGKMHGYGIYEFKDKSYHKGYWKNGKEHGKGEYFLTNGNKLVGTWNNGKFIEDSDEESEESDDKKNTNSLKVKELIKMVKSQGVYEIPVTINGSIKLNFIMDTGASDMFITPEILLTLIRSKTIDDDDLLEGQYYQNATGDINENVRFNIKEIKIGNTTVKNVSCALSENLEAPILLGQSVLSKLGKIMLDFKSATFYIME